MEKESIDFQAIPDGPGVYLFKDGSNTVLYAGRASNLRSRVRSYFSERIGADRGQRIVEMVAKAKKVDYITVDSVLEAYILEAGCIKELEPAYNVVDKDNKSFQFVGITQEDFPRVLVVRGRDLERGVAINTFKHIFGPFPRGALLKEALRIIRKIFPYRDSCTPYNPDGRNPPKRCFRAQLNLCPGVCAGLVDKKEYAKRVREIRLFFEGKKKQLLTSLEREMKQLAKEQEFERAQEVRRRIFALRHIQDVSLLQDDAVERADTRFRIEAYDVAHLRGEQTVGVMTVLIDGEPDTAEYRSFTIRAAKPGDDTGALSEVLSRRLAHTEWRFPHLIVVDGGRGQIRAAEKVLQEHAVHIPVVSVVKTERHAPREVLGEKEYTNRYEKDIVRANAEAHRFAVAKHRHKRSKKLFRG